MLLDELRRAAEERSSHALTRRRRIAHTGAAPHQSVGKIDEAQPASLLTFCSNDYLGLASHPEVVAALAEGAHRYGAGSGASHLVSGHSLAHARLEAELERWFAPYISHARALYFCTGYMANMAVLTALGGANATLFCESLNHASLIDGARLARADVQRYPHCDVAALEAMLAASTRPLKLIVTDSVFSMDGDVAPLVDVLRLAERYDAWIIVDDAHGFGVLGESGHGALQELGLASERFVYIGTLGKAAGVAGAFVAAHETIVEHLINTARPYIYTTAAPPAVAHALMTSLSIIEGEEGRQRRANLRCLISTLRSGLARLSDDAGWRLGESQTAIQPLIVGDNAEALALSAALETDGIRVGAIRPPTVPEGTARLRITLSASHTQADVQRLLTALAVAVSKRELA